MSRADTYVQDLARLREIETTLRNELNQHQSEEARALEDALRQLMLANKAATQAIRDSHGGAAQQARDKALEAGRKATEVSQQIARNEKLQENTLSRLRSAERAQQVHQLARLVGIAEVRHEPLRSPTTEKLRVLYLTTHPYLDLMTELEVRQVQQALQGMKYRERIDVRLQPAASFPELIASLNSVRPHIVHLSGGLDFSALVHALVTTQRAPELLMLNACGPLDRATPVLPAVPVVIGFAESMLDTAAIVFSQHFYAAIANGQSVGAAFRLGMAKVEVVLLEDDASELPECVVREDVDLDALVLVRS